MSWESVSEQQHPCPCGEGFFTAIVEMDDWNRTRSGWVMGCLKCREEYIDFRSTAYDSGLSYTAHRWVKVKAHQQYKKLSTNAKAVLGKAQNLAAERYCDLWLQYFDGKNKKQVWEILTNNGNHYPSLGTFYKHCRPGREGLNKYLRWFFQNDYERALLIMHTRDAELEKMRIEHMELITQAGLALRS